MGLLDSANAASVRIFGVLTALFGLIVVSSWGLISAVILIIAGGAAYFIGGDPNAQGVSRRVGWFIVYFALLVLAVGFR